MTKISAEEVEKQLLATMIIETGNKNNSIIEFVLNNGITEDDFTNQTCRKVFERMTKHGDIDYSMLCTALPECTDDILHILENASMTAYLPEWCTRLKEYSARRMIANACGKMTGKAADPKSDFRSVLTEFNTAAIEQQNRLEVRQKKRQEDMFLDYIEAMNGGRAEKDVIPYGLPIDAYIKHRRGEVFTLGAAAGTGKTMFALSAMLNMALKGYKVILFCEEMPFSDLNDRLIANLGDIPYEAVQTGQAMITDEWKLSLMATAERLSELYKRNYLRILGSGQYTHSSKGIEAELQQFYNEAGGVDFFCVDYIQRVMPSRDSKDEVGRISAAMSEITSLAIKFNAAALVLSQLSRSGQQQGNNKYSNTALKGSSQIEQDSSIIARLLPVIENGKPNEGKRQIAVTKARNFRAGGNGELIFEGKFARFSSHSKSTDPDETYDNPEPEE